MKKKTRFDLQNSKIIDIHTHSTGVLLEHLIDSCYPVVQDIIDLSEKITDAGVDYAVTFPMPFPIYYDAHCFWNNNQFVCSNLDHFPYYAENTSMLQYIEKFNLHNLLPFLSISVNDKVNQQIAFIEKCIRFILYMD